MKTMKGKKARQGQDTAEGKETQQSGKTIKAQGKRKKLHKQKKSENRLRMFSDTQTEKEKVSSFTHPKWDQKLQGFRKYPILDPREDVRGEMTFEVLSNSKIPQVTDFILQMRK